MKVSKLSGTQLDYWVAIAEGWEKDPLRPPSEYQIRIKHGLTYQASHLYSNDGFCYALCGDNRPYSYSPSTNWALAGVIIERERIIIAPAGSPPDGDYEWRAQYPKHPRDEWNFYGPAPLVVAMRAFVHDRFGDEVPEE
jgi:hypothetical protein